MWDAVREETAKAIRELLDIANIKEGGLVVVGCSSSEISGGVIGKASAPEAAKAVLDGILPELAAGGLYLAAQCCEHLNRALVIEGEAAERLGLEIVAAVPKPDAGGSFAAAAYEAFAEPVLVEHVKAAAGLDIGDTLIGMHLRDVAVPVRLKTDKIGLARVIAARTRPKFIGGSRAKYE